MFNDKAWELSIENECRDKVMKYPVKIQGLNSQSSLRICIENACRWNVLRYPVKFRVSTLKIASDLCIENAFRESVLGYPVKIQGLNYQISLRVLYRKCLQREFPEVSCRKCPKWPSNMIVFFYTVYKYYKFQKALRGIVLLQKLGSQ